MMAIDKDVIAARRQAIRDAAPCEGCGTSLASCKAARGQDPTAPEWFGCCAQGVDMRPCRHVVDRRAMAELLDEIESGAIRTVAEATPKPANLGMSWAEYVEQGEKWKPNGRPMVAIADMDETWRFNASRWLVRNATGIAAKFARGTYLLISTDHMSERTADQLLDDAHHATANPEAWIQRTPLHTALTRGLPADGPALAELADRARHYSTCPQRENVDGECTCRAASDRADA
ncbi:MAG TPA: hypothetical protein VK453_25140 [Micromonosporaceae bacterium]|nr:hypothetical protein [Micromonosporaceae bacterium]